MTDTKEIDLENLKEQIATEILPDLVNLPLLEREELKTMALEIAADVTTAISLGRKDISGELRNQIYALGRIRRISISSHTMQALLKTLGVVVRTIGAAII
jgi:hypothetical protein